jgi:hypothetical protein
MKQMVRTLTDALDGFCLGKTHLIEPSPNRETRQVKIRFPTVKWLQTNGRAEFSAITIEKRLENS